MRVEGCTEIYRVRGQTWTHKFEKCLWEGVYFSDTRPDTVPFEIAGILPPKGLGPLSKKPIANPLEKTLETSVGACVC